MGCNSHWSRNTNALTSLFSTPHDGDPEICLTDEQRLARAPQLEAPPLPLSDVIVPPHDPIDNVRDDEEGVTLESPVEEHVEPGEGDHGPATPIGSHNILPEQEMEPVIEADAELDPPSTSRYIGDPHVDTAKLYDKRPYRDDRGNLVTKTITGQMMRRDISGTIIYRGSKRPPDITTTGWTNIINAARQNKVPVAQMTADWRRVASRPQHPQRNS